MNRLFIAYYGAVSGTTFGYSTLQQKNDLFVSTMGAITMPFVIPGLIPAAGLACVLVILSEGSHKKDVDND